MQYRHSTYFSSSIASKPGRQSQIAKVGRGLLTVTSPQILGKSLQPEEVIQNWVYPAHRSNSIMHVRIEQSAWQRASAQEDRFPRNPSQEIPVLEGAPFQWGIPFPGGRGFGCRSQVASAVF